MIIDDALIKAIPLSRDERALVLTQVALKRIGKEPVSERKRSESFTDHVFATLWQRGWFQLVFRQLPVLAMWIWFVIEASRARAIHWRVRLIVMP